MTRRGTPVDTTNTTTPTPIPSTVCVVPSTCVRCGRQWVPTRTDVAWGFGSGDRCTPCAQEVWAKIADLFGRPKG
jgi:hypothetical protein